MVQVQGSMCDICTQLQIVDKLLGALPGLTEEIEERRQNFVSSFPKGATNDGGYRIQDMPVIAYKYLHVWGEGVSVNENFIWYGHVLLRAFQHSDLQRIKELMRLMIAGSNRIGKMTIEKGVLSATSTTRQQWKDIVSSPGLHHKHTGEDEGILPDRLPEGNSDSETNINGWKLPDSLLLKSIDCTTENESVVFNRIPNLV